MTEPIHVPIAHLSTVESVAWYRARDGRDLLLSAGHDDTVRGWDALTGRPHGPAYRGAGRNVVLLGGVALPGGPELILAVEHDGVYRWDAGTGEPLRPAADNPTDRTMRSPTCAALVQPDGSAPLLLTGDSRGQLHLWDPTTGTGKVTGLLVTGTGPDRTLVTGARAGSITIQPWPAPPSDPGP